MNYREHLRTGPYKNNRYIYPPYIEELHDLKNDPEVLVNLAEINEHHDLLNQFRLQLFVELKEQSGGFLHLLPAPIMKTIF